MKIAIFGQSFNRVFNEPIERFLTALANRQHELIVFHELAGFLKQNIRCECHGDFSSHSDLKDIDLMIAIGGDGTMLNTLLYVRDSGTPVLGLNTGRLGFLSTINTDEIDEVIAAIDSGDYEIAPRTVLHLESAEGMFLPVNYALNEVAVHKNDISSMITINAYLDDIFLNSYWADGLIISTATGSTAYSMSCGGPIVMPGTETLVITPIAPHNLNIRPLIVPDTAILRLEVEGREKQHLISLDSRSETVKNSQTLTISKAPFKMNLLRIRNQHFIQTIRQKLMWGLDRRN